MDSNYIIKVFDKDDVFKRTLSRKEVNGDIRFSSVLWSWFSDLSLRVQNKGETTLKETTDTGGGDYYQTVSYSSGLGIAHWDIVRVVDPNQNIIERIDTGGGNFYKQVTDKPIYSGVVIEITHSILSSGEYHDIDIMGIQSTLKDTLYTNWSSKSFTKTADPAVILKEILDLVGYLSYTWTSIETYWSNVSIEFDNVSCMEAVKSVVESVGRLVSYDADGVVYFYEEEETPAIDHRMSFLSEIIEVKDTTKSFDMVNRLVLHYKNWWPWHDTPFNDLTSQWLYGVKERYIEKLNIENSETASIFAAAYLAKYWYPVQELSVVVSDKFDVGIIKVGDTIKINWYYNANKTYYVYRIDFTPWKVLLQLNSQQSIEKTLKSLQS